MKYTSSIDSGRHDGKGHNGGLRAFSLDRLASIFAQIASTGGVEKLGGGARAAIALGRTIILICLPHPHPHPPPTLITTITPTLPSVNLTDQNVYLC